MRLLQSLSVVQQTGSLATSQRMYYDDAKINWKEIVPHMAANTSGSAGYMLECNFHLLHTVK